MELREKVLKLLAINLRPDERKVLDFIIEANGDVPLDGLLFPTVEAHIEARFEWFYTPDGVLRGKVA